MSCNFNLKNCIRCPKYNGCLLQLVYTNTINLSNVLGAIIDNQCQLNNSINQLKELNTSAFYANNIDQNVEAMADIKSIKVKLENIDLNTEEVLTHIGSIKSTIEDFDIVEEEESSDD